MPALYKQLKKLPWTAIPATSAVSTGHGRRARRTIKAVLARARTGFAGAAQVAQVRRTVTRKGKKTVEVVYLISSDRGADPATLAAWARDVTYQEDKSLVRTGNAARVMASLRSLAISLLRLDGQPVAAANRHHARDPRALFTGMSGSAVSLAAGLPQGKPARAPAAPETGTPGSAAVVEGHLVAVGVGEREGAAERPVGGR